MTQHSIGEQNKRIEIFKYEKGNLNKYNKNNPYWSHNTKMSEILNKYGLFRKDIMMIYCIV